MIDWLAVASIVVTVPGCMALGYVLGYGMGYDKATRAAWKRRDDEWDAEHGL